MANKSRYRIWCVTDSKYEETMVTIDGAVPTVCPVDGGHTIDTARTAIVATVPPDDAGGYRVVEEYVVSGSGIQTHDFAYPLVEGKAYIIDAFVKNDNAASATYSPRLNDEATAGSRQYHTANSTTNTTQRSANTVCASIYQGEEGWFRLLLPRITQNVSRFISNWPVIEPVNDTPDFQVRTTGIYIATPTGATALTSFGVGSNKSDGFGIGTVLQLIEVG